MTKRQEEIIDAALKLTSEGGIQNLTLKHLSQAVGISEPALYRHFKNKGEIVKAMITRFEKAVSVAELPVSGFSAIKEFVKRRIEQVCETPELARVMFAEELFMDEPEFEELLFEMMHRHKEELNVHFRTARKNGEIRSDISLEMTFRLVFAPVRLLVKQWGMTRGGFDLRKKGKELLETLEIVLSPITKQE